MRLAPALLLALAGCVIPNAHLKVDRGLKAVPPDRGILIFSSGATVAGYTGGILVKAEGPFPPELLTPDLHSAVSFVIGSAAEPSHFGPEEGHGHVRVLVTRPGIYCFRFSPLSSGMRFVKEPPEARVRVRPGVVTYAGSFHLDAAERLGVLDRLERDVGYVRGWNPGFDPGEVGVSPARLVKRCTSLSEGPAAELEAREEQAAGR